MNFPDLLLPQSLLWPANLLAAALLGFCIWKAPWRRLADSRIQHLWLACCVGLMLVWSVKAGIKPGLTFHLLGATVLTLMFGPMLALVALAAVLVGVTFWGTGGWMSLGINFIVMAALPVLFSYAIYCQAHYKLPKHVFVYILLDAFLTAGLAIFLSGIAATAILASSGAYRLSYLKEYFLIYYILMGWSEAILTGMAATLMVVYKPDWLATFSDKLYLSNK